MKKSSTVIKEAYYGPKHVKTVVTLQDFFLAFHQRRRGRAFTNAAGVDHGTSRGLPP